MTLRGEVPMTLAAALAAHEANPLDARALDDLLREWIAQPCEACWEGEAMTCHCGHQGYAHRLKVCNGVVNDF